MAEKKVTEDAVYQKIRYGFGREPDDPRNATNYLEMAAGGASMKEIEEAMKKDTPASEEEHRKFLGDLGLEYKPEVRVERFVGALPEEEEVVPFEESVIAQRAMDNAEMEAKAYEDYYSVLLGENNGDYDRMQEEIKQDYVAAVKTENTERILFLERIAEDVETNKSNLGQQANILASQGVEALGLANQYRERREGEVREDYDTGALRVRDDLEYLQEKLGTEGARLVEDYERARSYGDVDRSRALEGITDKYRVQMESLGKKHSKAQTWRSGQRLTDVDRMLRAQGRETETAMAAIDRPLEEARLKSERGQSDITTELARAGTEAGRAVEDLQRSMERDLADMQNAGARDRLALKQSLQDKAMSLQQELGGEADPIIQAMNDRLGTVGMEPIDIGPAPTAGRANIEAGRAGADIQRGFEERFGGIPTEGADYERLLREPGHMLSQLGPGERGGVGREFERGLGQFQREGARRERELGFEKRAGMERALLGAEEGAYSEYTRRLGPGYVSPERAAEFREGGFGGIAKTVFDKYGRPVTVEPERGFGPGEGIQPIGGARIPPMPGEEGPGDYRISPPGGRREEQRGGPARSGGARIPSMPGGGEEGYRISPPGGGTSPIDRGGGMRTAGMARIGVPVGEQERRDGGARRLPMRGGAPARAAPGTQPGGGARITPPSTPIDKGMARIPSQPGRAPEISRGEGARRVAPGGRARIRPPTKRNGGTRVGIPKKKEPKRNGGLRRRTT